MSTEPAQVLELIEIPIAEIARPTHSLILADKKFLTALKAVEATVSTLVITDAQSAQQAADLLVRLTSAGTAVEKQRVALKAPYLRLMEAVEDAANGAKTRIQAAKRTLSLAQSKFAQEQRDLAAKQEKERQDELNRLEQKRQAEEKAANEKAQQVADDLKRQQEESAKLAKAAREAGIPCVEEEDWGDAEPAPVAPPPPQKTETEKQIEAVRYAPAPVVTKSAGVRETLTLYPHCEDINKVPDAFVKKEFKLAAVQATFCRGWKEGDALPVCAGVRFEIQRAVVSTGKGDFKI